MKSYSVEFEYKIKEYGECTIVADTSDSAEDAAEDYIRQFYPDVEDIEITGIREIHGN